MNPWLVAFGLERKQRQLPCRNVRRVGPHFIIDDFAISAANLNPNLRASKIVLSVSTGQQDIDLAWPGLLLNSGIQTYDAGIYTVGEAAVKAQRFAGITKDFVLL